MIGHGQLDARIRPDRRTGLGHHLAVDGDLPREDQRARAFPRRGEAAVNQYDI
jgi:hypothetical protein